jgi:hypothetical protein
LDLTSEGPTPGAEGLAPDDYCRQVEAYLCRKNDGHLIRIVGPAFEQVCSWADRGVPLKAVFRGIDRYFERYYAKGPRRRPVRVEFCAADVLDVFDEWRRAVGVAVVDAEPSTNKRGSLPAHLDRVLARLTAVPGEPGAALEATIGHIVQELDAGRTRAKSLRGEARSAFLERLRALDTELVEAARAACDPDTLGQLAGEAKLDLAPFRGRMPREAYEQARKASVDRLIRERYRLPVVAFD